MTRALHEFAASVLGLSVIDEHPRVIPAPGVSGDLSPMNTPAQAELGRGTLGRRNDAQGRATRPMQPAIPLSRLGFSGELSYPG